jgi:metal-dependent HD superfamily phosphatase/phosphodiesterase
VAKLVTLDDVKLHPRTHPYLEKANEHSGRIGLNEHGFRHSGLVSSIAGNILERLEYCEREIELSRIAGYMHDVGNAISRHNHGLTGALLVEGILKDLEMDAGEIATIIGAIGNHEEEHGQPVSNVSAALILADKSDVHRSRVRNTDIAAFDIHDRVNYAVVHSFLNVDASEKTVSLQLTIETEICPVIEYFEIFLSRMLMCRRAAILLDVEFKLVVNGAFLL